jgi:DegV family protein with EDD domain
MEQQMIKLVTDSTCDLSPEYYARYDIHVVPINIQFGSQTYQDGITISRSEFYEKIEELQVLPATSQPSPAQFEDVYRRLSTQGATDIISVHVTSKLSGTYQSAVLAQELAADAVRVHPVDSACGSAGLGFMCVEAARMLESGHSLQEVLDRLETLRSRITVVLSVRDLRYAQMSGRVSRLQSSLSSLLNIRPVILLQEGLLSMVDKVRTSRKAAERLLDLTEEAVGRAEPINLAIIHAEAVEDGQALLEKALERFPNISEHFLEDLATSLAVHFGPGTLGIVSYRT